MEPEKIDITSMPDDELLARFGIPATHPEDMKAKEEDMPWLDAPGTSPRLSFGCLGNGLTFCDVDIDERSDYKRVGHWQPNTHVFSLYSTHEPRLVREAIDYLRSTSERVLLTDRRRGRP